MSTACAGLVGFSVYLLALGKGPSEGLIAPPPAIAIAYAAAIIATAVFHLRYTRTQRQFLIRPRPWRDFAVISLCEWTTASATAIFCSRRVIQITALELFCYCFLAATITRYVLRKEFLQDIRGLRKGIHLDRVGEDRVVADATLPRPGDLATSGCGIIAAMTPVRQPEQGASQYQRPRKLRPLPPLPERSYHNLPGLLLGMVIFAALSTGAPSNRSAFSKPTR